MAQAEATERAAAEGDDSQPDLTPGTVVEGRYRVTGILGEGGVGTVYRAEDLKLPREVALKVLQGRHIDHASLKTRFAREARALAALNHPNIVHVSDYGVTDGKPFVVMEILEGRTLREALDAGPLPPARAFEITRQLLKGLAYAHSRGLVHRDIKPGNIFLQKLDSETELVKILDFGFAKFVEGAETSLDANVSRDGLAFGTLSYLAPEQATGAQTDARSDVYSMGVVLFEMLAGVKPFQGSLIDIVRAHLTARVPRISSVSRTRKETPELHKLIEKAMAKSPAERFADASAFLRAVDALPKPAIHETAPRRAFGVGTVALVVLAGGLVAVAAHLATRPDPKAEWQSWVTAAEAALGGSAATGESTPEAEATSTEPGGTATDPAHEDTPGATGASEGSPSTREGEVPEEYSEAAELFASVRASLEAGEPISDESLAALRGYVRGRDDMPPAHLLLAHVYIERGWVSDALHEYETAYDGNPRVKDDPRVLRNLVHVYATSLNLDREAEELLEKIYGVDALPAIEAELADGLLPWDGRARLSRLQRRLAARARAATEAP